MNEIHLLANLGIMLKKVLIAFGVLVVLVVVALVYLNHRNRTLSPPAEQRITTSMGLTVEIDYSRPSVRGRLIFGEASDGALQPYGKYWRLGANEATVLHFSEAVEVNGRRIESGSYGVFAFPGPEFFEIGLNSEWDRWGASEPDYSRDAVRLKVPVQRLNQPVEQFTIHLGELGNEVQIICEWSDVRFVIPLKQIN